MKYLAFILILLLPFPAFADRLYQSGLELQSATAGVEFSAAGIDAGGINTTTFRSGAAAMRLNPTAQFSWFGHTFRTTPVNNEALARVYVRYATLPGSGTPEVMGFWNSSTVAMEATIKLNSADNTLGIYDRNGTKHGSSSSALSANTWYMVELRLLADSAGGAATIAGRLDGVEFASTTSGVSTTFNALYIGLPGGAGTLDAYYDDIAVNSALGNDPKSWPGSGNIVLVKPTAAGDSNCTTGDWSMVTEIPPSDTATSGSTMCELDANPTTAFFNSTDASAAGIGSSDTITAVLIMGRVREESSGASNYTLRLRSASGGTAHSSSSVDAGDTTVRTNPSGTTAFGISGVFTTDPTTGVAWTPTGTNSIDNLQIGAGTTDGSPDTWVLGLYVMVEFIPAVVAAADPVQPPQIIIID